ncbi:MAG: hypothetical protein JWN78_814 [Bacteroidota bacterium]|nr:hypothetical protein [Bacteroidota bacterium]
MEEEQMIDEVPEEMESQDFTQGFNHAYILAGYDAELLNEIEPALNPESDYFHGFFSGRDEYNREREELSLTQLRKLTTERDYDIEL